VSAICIPKYLILKIDQLFEFQKYKLSGDTLYNDKKNETGLAIGNVELFSKGDNLFILGSICQWVSVDPFM